MPALFDDYGIRFQYPENWTLEMDEDSPEGSAVSVYAPGGGFWSVLTDGHHGDPANLARTALEALQREYDTLDSEETLEQLEGVDVVGYDINFICLDLTNTARVRAWRTPASTYMVICQAEDREFEKLGDVFRAITASLLREKAPGARVPRCDGPVT